MAGSALIEKQSHWTLFASNECDVEEEEALIADIVLKTPWEMS